MLIISKGLIFGNTYVQVSLVWNLSLDRQDTQRKTYLTCVLIVLVHHTPLSPPRWQNITGLPRATSPMKPPPTKPSSAPSLHRYTHMFQHQQHKQTLSSLLLSGSHVFHCVCHTLQDTLAYATALLNEKEQSGSSNGSDGSPANENADRSLRQVAISRSSGAKCSAQRASYMTHCSCSVHAAKKREEWNKNGTSHWLLSNAVKAVCCLPRLLLAVDLKLLHSSLTPAVADRIPIQHRGVGHK